jgi:hypothetical protein
MSWQESIFPVSRRPKSKEDEMDISVLRLPRLALTPEHLGLEPSLSHSANLEALSNRIYMTIGEPRSDWGRQE